MSVCLIIDGHQWMQALPLKDNVLVCMTCDSRVPMGRSPKLASCASIYAHKHGLRYGVDVAEQK